MVSLKLWLVLWLAYITKIESNNSFNDFFARQSILITQCQANGQRGGTCNTMNGVCTINPLSSATNWLVESYCHCKTGFFGYDCNTNPCSNPNLCLNGGTCGSVLLSNGAVTFYCVCTSEFFGRNCQYNLFQFGINNRISDRLKTEVLQNTSDALTIIGLFNRQLAVAYENTQIKLFNVVNGIETLTIIGHTNNVNALAVLPNGDLVSGSTDRSIRIWNVVTGSNKRLYTAAHAASILFLKVLPNGNLISASSTTTDRTIRVWNTSDISNSPVRTIPLPALTSTALHDIAALKNGHVASAAAENSVRIWNITSASSIRLLAGHTQPIRALLVLPNGDLVTGSNDRTIRVWNVETGAVKALWTAHTGPIRALDVLLNGDIVSSSNDRTIRIWEANTYRSKRNITGLTEIFTSLASLRNGFFASQGNQTVRVWEP